MSAETRDKLLEAFGTVWNAYRQLQLSKNTDVSFPTFARAYRGKTISPEQLAAIVTAWESRRRQPVSQPVSA